MRPEIESNSTPMNRIPSLPWLMKLPMPQPAPRPWRYRHSQAGNRIVDGRDYGRRGIEGVERRAFGAVVFRGTQ